MFGEVTLAHLASHETATKHGDDHTHSTLFAYLIIRTSSRLRGHSSGECPEHSVVVTSAAADGRGFDQRTQPRATASLTALARCWEQRARPLYPPPSRRRSCVFL